MHKNVSPHDLELLSEYLDGRLDARQRDQLEARLRSTKELADTLQGLTQTRTLLRSLPKLKAPRSFRLTPEMAGKSATPRLYPAFQFASILASLLLVLVLAGDFLGLGASTASRMTAPAAAPMLATQYQDMGPTAEAALAQLPTQQKSLAGSSNPQPYPAESTAALAAAAPQATENAPRIAAQGARDTSTATITGSTEISPTLENPQAAFVNPPAAQLTTTQEPISQTQVTLENPPAPETQSLNAAQPVETPAPAASLPVLRIIEIVLITVALGTGLAAFFLRRGLGI
jgi:anti-sigma factor RsiW